MNISKSAVTILLIVLSSVVLAGCSGKQTEKFASCLTEKGAVMYGAFWCPHCMRQKEMFGDSFNSIKYVECSLPDRSGQTQECIDAKIESYPTWEFSDGSRASGVQSFGQLSSKTGCAVE